MTSKRKVVIITGASRGIGAALVKRFRELDYGVVATSRSIMKTGFLSDDPTLRIEGDISEPDTAARVVDAAMERFGRMDLLINNAGIFIPKPFVDYSLHDFTSMIGVNLRGFFHISQLAASRMLQAGFGHIVNITAAIADQPLAALPAALAALTKGGLAAATRSLAIEYATRGYSGKCCGTWRSQYKSASTGDARDVNCHAATWPNGRDPRRRRRRRLSGTSTVHHRRDPARGRRGLLRWWRLVR